MLVVELKPGESVVIGNSIALTVLPRKSDHNIRVGVTAPRDQIVLRDEPLRDEQVNELDAEVRRAIRRERLKGE